MDWEADSVFDLANNRLGYSELLRPDAGYTLDCAVGTTYSLDLEALLGVPVSLGLLDQDDSESIRSPLYVLEAIRRSADKIALFCNAGCIQLPKRIEPVYSLLENSVFEVKLLNRGNFHPKVWVLKYSQDGKNPYIKVLVMSRNLTFDNSIDIAVAMQGTVGNTENERHKPLADFLRFVSDFAGKKKQSILDLAEDVLKVTSFEMCHPFAEKEGYDFYPVGITGYKGNNVPLMSNKQELFCISPFLSDGIVQELTQFRGPKCLVTRKASVTPAVWEAFNHNVYVTKDVLNDNEYGVNQDIHAKIYYVTTRKCNYLYLGSANASENAFNRNVEFLLRLHYKLGYMGYKTFFSDFIPSVNCPYELLHSLPDNIEPDDKEQQQEIEDALREAVYALKRAAVTKTGEKYNILVEAKSFRTKQEVEIAPLQCLGAKKALREKVEFSGLLLKQLSEFYVLSAGGKELIVKIRTSGIPKDRDQAIYRSIIDTNRKFLNYLSFALTDELPGEQDEQEATSMNILRAGEINPKAKSAFAVYEQMLRVFHSNPGKLKGIADMIKRLDPKVVGEEFLKMFRMFEETAKKVRR